MPASTPRRLTRRGLFVAATAAVGAVALSACSSDDSGLAEQADSADGKGYISGDGTVTEYREDERGEPVVFSGKLFTGEEVTGESLRGAPAVVNFWYAGCAPCRAEAPHLRALHDEFGDGVGFLGVNLRDERGTAEAFERNFGIDYPSIEDRAGGVLMDLSNFVPAQAVPTTLVLDPEGRVSARVLGQIDESVLRTLIDDVLPGGGSGSGDE
ncbi:TlpA family protein disulfide reductase [Rothia sp. AR01]|uniref:TlpA family protein disulfide reductase n=1 Tax=Rothia santali TaxID=2949643 RepID=A0A9X2KHQ7_9MICC|nr:TlpA disulfide reductase family protein [Rothia santali]MCP3425034.1 TlpA family protein disulfide reductase [Rothia santali]